MPSTDSAQSAPARGPRRRSGRRFWGSLLLLLVAAFGIVWYTNLELFTLTADVGNPPMVVFQLISDPPRLLESPANSNSQADLEVFRRSQAAIITLPQLIERTLALPSHQSPPLLAAAPDQTNVAEWIKDRLHVEFPAPDIMQLTISGVPRPDSVRLLNALADEYLELVVGSVRMKRLERYSALEKVDRDLQADVRKKRNELKQITERILGTRDERLRAAELAAYETMLVNLNRMRVDLYGKEALLEHLQKMAAATEPVADDEINREVERDPILAAMSARRIVLQSLLADAQTEAADSAPPERSLWEQELNALTKSEAAHRETLRQPVALRLNEAVKRDQNSEVKKRKDDVSLLKTTCERLEAEAVRIESKLKESGKFSIEIEMMQDNLNTLEAIEREVSETFLRQGIELQAMSPINNNNDDPSSRIRILYRAH